jgi:hypothetical protein
MARKMHLRMTKQVQSRQSSDRKAEKFMASPKTKKCAQITCLCDVKDGDEYCGEACHARGREDVKIACQCDHLACPCVVVVATVAGQSRHQEK